MRKQQFVEKGLIG